MNRQTKMALEDRIHSSVDAALNELTARVDKDVRAIAQQLIAAALEERDEAVRAASDATRREVAAEAQRQLEAAEAQARVRLEAAEAQARFRGREAELAAVRRLVESVRSLDAAVTLSEVLDALTLAARREASRAAVLVVRQERLLGWRLAGFDAQDAQPRSVDLGLTEKDIVGLAVQDARVVSTDETGARSPAFANSPGQRIGLAVPVTVGGRVVAVVYADLIAADGQEPEMPSAWREGIEVLARHAARCLEALTVQKTVTTAVPRFWMQAAGRSGVTA